MMQVPPREPANLPHACSTSGRSGLGEAAMKPAQGAPATMHRTPAAWNAGV